MVATARAPQIISDLGVCPAWSAWLSPNWAPVGGLQAVQAEHAAAGEAPDAMPSDPWLPLLTCSTVP
jgi:hypothetical protein